MAESSGETTRHNAIPPDNSYGLWQINMIGSMGPDRRKKLGISSNEQLYDPGTNARAMMMVSGGGTDFKHWTTYTTGMYKAFLKSGSGTTTNAVNADATDANILTNPAGTISDAVGVLVDAANWIVNPSNWLRVLYVTAGAAVVLVGLDMLVNQKLLGAGAQALGGEKSGSSLTNAATIGKKAMGGKAGMAKGAAKSAAAKGAAKSAAKGTAAKAASAKSVASRPAAQTGA